MVASKSMDRAAERRVLDADRACPKGTQSAGARSLLEVTMCPNDLGASSETYVKIQSTQNSKNTNSSVHD